MTDFGLEELGRLAFDLGNAGAAVIPKVKEIVEETGAKVAIDWSEDAAKASGSHAKNYSKTIFSKMELKVDGEIGATVRPRRGHQGNLGEVLELGGGGILSKPQHSGRKALAKNEAEFIDRLGKAGEDALNA